MKPIHLILIALIGYYSCSPEVVRHGPGVVAVATPQQKNIGSPQSFEYKGYTVKPLATFAIEARILSKERYWMGREAELSPVDLALGWGSMSDETVLDQLDISQGGRFYYWRANSLPIPAGEISSHSANMHLIPADENVASVLKGRTREGDIVRFSGYLVSVVHPDGWRWKSSLTRNDTGAGACELVYVETLQVL